MSKLIFFSMIIFCLLSSALSQSPCEITQTEEKSFKLINCTYVATHSLFFIKIDLLTTEDGVTANYWNSKIVRKDSLIPLQVTNEFIFKGEEPHKVNSNTTLLMPNAINKDVNGNLYEWNLRLCQYDTNPTGISGLLAKCNLKYEAKIKI